MTYYNARLCYRDFPVDVCCYRFVRVVAENPWGWKIRSWREPFGRWVSHDAMFETVDFIA